MIELYTVWKQEKEPKQYQWKLQMQKGVLSFSTKKDATEMSKILKSHNTPKDVRDERPLTTKRIRNKNTYKPKLNKQDLVDFLDMYRKEWDSYSQRLIAGLESKTIEAFGSTSDYLNELSGRIHMICNILDNYEV